MFYLSRDLVSGCPTRTSLKMTVVKKGYLYKLPRSSMIKVNICVVFRVILVVMISVTMGRHLNRL